MNLAARLRTRHAKARNRRMIDDAIANAATPGMRHELIAMAHQQLHVMR